MLSSRIAEKLEINTLPIGRRNVSRGVVGGERDAVHILQNKQGSNYADNCTDGVQKNVKDCAESTRDASLVPLQYCAQSDRDDNAGHFRCEPVVTRE